jgi:hypothetical protein
MFGAGNALVDVVDANADVLAVSCVMFRVKVCPIRSLSSSSILWYNASDDTDLCPVMIWHNNVPLGEKTLGNFMSVLSKNCDLSQTYTNHSIRASGATLLAKHSYCHSQIMAITGHKSVSW